MQGIPYNSKAAQYARLHGLNLQDTLPPELQITADSLAQLKEPVSPHDNAPVVEEFRYTLFNNQALNIGIASQLVLRAPATRRTFLLIVNTHATQTMFLRFGAASDAIIGLPIQPLFGFFGLDTVVAQDDIHLVGNGAATTGVLIYSNA